MNLKTVIMQTHKKSTFSALICLIGLSLLSQATAFGQSALVKHQQDFIETQVGETFETIVQFNTDNTPISVFDLHMQFNPEFMEVVSIENLQGDLFSFHQPPVFDNAIGKIDMAGFQIGKSIPTADFDMVKITFLALEAVELTELIHPLNEFPKTMLAYGGMNMLGEAQDLKITITGGDPLGGISGTDKGDFGLEVWPNPTNGLALISFRLDSRDRVNLGVYDISGKLIQTVFEGMVSPDTEMRFEIDLKGLANGNYACRLQTQSSNQTKVLVLTD